MTLEINYVDLAGEDIHFYIKQRKISRISEERPWRTGELRYENYIDVFFENGGRAHNFNATKGYLGKVANELGFLHPEDLVGETLPFLYRETRLIGILKKIIDDD